MGAPRASPSHFIHSTHPTHGSLIFTVLGSREFEAQPRHAVDAVDAIDAIDAIVTLDPSSSRERRVTWPCIPLPSRPVGNC